MKIKTKDMDYAEVLARKPRRRLPPHRPNLLFRTLFAALSAPELRRVAFSCKKEGMERLGRHEPCLYLMNHSCFTDLKIAAHLLYPRPFQIVCTSDGFVGKAWLMRHMGCIPTNKFVSDPALVRDMLFSLRVLHSSVLMYPEASYSFDGTATPLPDSLGRCLKLLGVPVVMITTEGAFAHDPLYNGLQPRRVRVSATMKYLLSPAEIEEADEGELMARLRAEFSFDNFRWQQERGVRVAEPFRADGLNRVLYKCPHCLQEGEMHGEGTEIICHRCGHGYTLTEDGRLSPLGGGEGKFAHTPDWYRWERACVRQEIEAGTYRLDVPVTIRMMVDTSAVYRVGEGRLVHTTEGFSLTGCGGRLDYRQKPAASYSLYADYFWYEIGDMICLGNNRVLYYCFPQGGADVVAKTRLATEELYKMAMAHLRRPALRG